MRVVTALPDLHLPWKKGNLSASLEPLDEEVFKAGINDSTASLVDADVAAGNCAFGGSGDCENALDYPKTVPPFSCPSLSSRCSGSYLTVSDGAHR